MVPGIVRYLQIEATPAHRLIHLGYDAVPDLIEALGDKRFARAVHFRYSSPLTVGECAEYDPRENLWPIAA